MPTARTTVSSSLGTTVVDKERYFSDAPASEPARGAARPPHSKSATSAETIITETRTVVNEEELNQAMAELQTLKSMVKGAEQTQSMQQNVPTTVSTTYGSASHMLSPPPPNHPTVYKIPYVEREQVKVIEREKPVIIYKDAGRLVERIVPSGPPAREIVYRDREVRVSRLERVLPWPHTVRVTVT